MRHQIFENLPSHARTYILTHASHGAATVLSRNLNYVTPKEENEKRTDEELVEVAIDLCIKIQEIHQKHVIHHDLKEDNVLVDAQGKVHVIDFGNADKEGEKCCYRRPSWSPMWMAPEVFSVVLSHPTQDVYSFGYLLMTIAEVMESP
ncbi:serine/threonine-protein kinase shk2-like [Penaeus monodon]|uniref:serine/threonine-protein kinase shk2-like n=1 Tax=Penaeus monodon TaxID=6687 RepID=UPI0018A7D25B|nr:serine/threonine-protein kinase shk2-like [Penaeus monodon]